MIFHNYFYCEREEANDNSDGIKIKSSLQMSHRENNQRAVIIKRRNLNKKA
jgi:hypothetical protein